MNIHSQKFKDDFGAYFQDLEISTNDHIKFHKIRNNNLDFFKKVYPLYVLLESLSNFRYYYYFFSLFSFSRIQGRLIYPS